MARPPVLLTCTPFTVTHNDPTLSIPRRRDGCTSICPVRLFHLCDTHPRAHPQSAVGVSRESHTAGSPQMATTSTAPEEPQAFTYVDEDTFAKLRNVGSRVRKSVTEGFQRTVSVPADPFSANKRLPFTQTPSFISANDAMRDIFGQRAANQSKKGSTSVPSSPKQHPKRAHAGPDEDNDVDMEPLDDADLDVDLEDEDEDDNAATASAIRKKREEQAKRQAEKAKREIKPLKRSASRGVATQSLPASMFRFSHEPTGTQVAPAVEKIAEEDDWSESFGAPGAVPTASLGL
ncbi:hypothetical protein LXA43DRAFT_1091261 [Ganoderma leucocontextum]|nr:hypothetical protein LXA43DRAFT_1091261 [Ganoderma leucocontextum]